MYLILTRSSWIVATQSTFPFQISYPDYDTSRRMAQGIQWNTKQKFPKLICSRLKRKDHLLYRCSDFISAFVSKVIILESQFSSSLCWDHYFEFLSDSFLFSKLIILFDSNHVLLYLYLFWRGGHSCPMHWDLLDLLCSHEFE